MTTENLSSWGRVHNYSVPCVSLQNRQQVLPTHQGQSFLAYGNGRSYGDSCLNAGGIAVKCRNMAHFIEFDALSGRLSCEAGVLLAEILQLALPQGWFLPVTPGTRFVTVGGAIANDVHGKNHHVLGTFGSHVTKFTLLRSDRQRLECSPNSNADYFAATIGGLGLTGIITWVELQLRRVPGPWINAESIRYQSLAEFFSLSALSDRDYEYTVSWVDCAQRKNLGRGLFVRGNHAPALTQHPDYRPRTRTFPIVPPLSLINAFSLQAFNQVYYHKQLQRHVRFTQHYEPFFYPLDGLLEWNRIYGPRGFYQYQCVIPSANGEAAMTELLQAISHSGLGSFLAVLKLCGDKPSPGLLSFPLPGVSLALDFPNRGEKLELLFKRMDEIVSAAHGRLYPAKDGRMPATLFRQGYSNWQQFSQFIDPNFSSSFWRRVMEIA